ncbi:DUF6233 domain-containing protein (plasmid) [Streptomyces goshikiensis]|nr:DUF6233 domain-containing protein [Streptomyces goshikiensis]WBY24364.1 DUF6233 domain-containing protein [Streptomyces goshikiensis]WSY03027.1 DUF6233 domain-containing protein [Streptomyces goshikiensis]
MVLRHIDQGGTHHANTAGPARPPHAPHARPPVRRSTGAEPCPSCRPTSPGYRLWSPTCAANSAARNRPSPPPEKREATTTRKQPAPEPPAWLVERGIGVGRLPVRVHAGHCWDTRSRCAPADADQIRALLAQGIPACPHCRPDTALGVLE